MVPAFLVVLVKHRSRPASGLCREKIIKLKKELETVRRTRDLNRAKRCKAQFTVVVIVGCTNVSKSTLFNRPTGTSALVEEMIFTTLDPTFWRVWLLHDTPIILSDTVGFIFSLPTYLTAAFRATMEEVVRAELVIYFLGIYDPDTAVQAEDVECILADLSIDAANTGRVVKSGIK